MAKLLNVKPTSVSSLTFPEEYTLWETGITQSLLGSWQQCPRKFLFAVNRWTQEGEGHSTGYGSMMHEALDKIYTNFFLTKSVTKAGLPELMERVIDEYPFNKKVFREEEIERMRTIGNAMGKVYLKRFQTDFTQYRFEAVERKFEQQVLGVKIKGKIDGRFRDKTGGVWNIEHKNFSRISEDSLQLKLSFDLQNLFYLLADKTEFNRQLKGTVYNILRRPDPRKFDSGKALYDFVVKEATKNMNYYFLRSEIPYSSSDLQQFTDELTSKFNILQGMISNAKNAPRSTLKIFYKNECGCESPYKCNFLAACASGNLSGYCQKKTMFPELEDVSPKPLYTKEVVYRKLTQGGTNVQNNPVRKAASKLVGQAGKNTVKTVPNNHPPIKAAKLLIKR